MNHLFGEIRLSLSHSPDLVGELSPLGLVGDVVGEDGAAESEDEHGLRLDFGRGFSFASRR